MAFDETLAGRIRSVLKRRRDVVEKRMFGGIAFMVRGHMCCGVVGPSLMIRVDPEQEAEFLQEPAARPMDFTGRPMRGFLFIDPTGTRDAASLRNWIGRATAHVETKPRKASVKRKRPGTRK